MRIAKAFVKLTGSLLIAAVAVFSQSDSLNRNLAANMAVFSGSLKSIIDEALKNNAALRASRYKVEAAEKSFSINKSLDPPQFNYETMQSAAGWRTMENAFSLQQMVPFPGKLSAKAGVERQRKAMYQSDATTVERDLVWRIKDAFYEMYLIDRKIAINADNRDFAQRAVTIAIKQYEVGAGQQADILRGQTELSNLLNDAIVLKQERNSLVAMINGQTNRPFSAGIDVIPEIEPPRADLAMTILEPIAFRHRPELASMKFNIAMLESELAMNKKERYPDFMVKGEYRNFVETGTSSWGGMAGVTIPIAPWSIRRYSSAVAQSTLQVRQAEAEIENMRNMIRAEIQDALYKVNSSQERMQLLKSTVIPQARQTLESTLSAYQNGKTEFLMLIDAERMQLMATEQYHMAVMNRLSAGAALERAVGVDWETIMAESTRGKQQ